VQRRGNKQEGEKFGERKRACGIKKKDFAAARIYMSRIERRAKLRKPPAMQSNPPSARATLFPFHPPHSPSTIYIFFLSPSILSLTLSALSQLSNLRPVDVCVFHARLRFRPLDAEERLIVAPFLSAAFTAAGKARWESRENGRAFGRIGKRGTIDFSVVHVTTDELLARGFSRTLDIHSTYFLIQGEEKRWEKRFYAIREKQGTFSSLKNTRNHQKSVET